MRNFQLNSKLKQPSWEGKGAYRHHRQMIKSPAGRDCDLCPLMTVIQVCFTGVPGLFYWCSRSVLLVFQVCFTGVPGLFYRCSRSVLLVFQVYRFEFVRTKLDLTNKGTSEPQ